MKKIDDNEVNEIVLPSRRPSELMSSDMQSIYRAQLTALWENVEGSQVNNNDDHINKKINNHNYNHNINIYVNRDL